MTTPRSTGDWSLAVHQQASVARIGQLGLRGGDVDEFLSEALDAVADGLGVRSVALLELLSSLEELQGRAAIRDGTRVPRSLVEQVQIPAGRESMPGFTVMEHQAVVSGDMEHDERFRALASDYGVPARAAISAPVGWGERPWGVLTAFSTVVRSWTDDDIHFVQSMANTIGLAIARERVEHELRDSSARLDLSLGAGGLGAWTWDLLADEVVLSPSALAIHGLDANEFDGSGERLLGLLHPDDQAVLRGEVFEAVQTTGEHHGSYRVIRPDSGETRWVEWWGRVLDDRTSPHRLVGVMSDITQRRRDDEIRAALLVQEQRARARAEQAHERLTLLAEAAERFSGSLDPDVILASLAEFCVPLLADVCLVDVLDEQGELCEVAAVGRDDHLVAAAQSLSRTSDDVRHAESAWGVRDVAAFGRSELRPDITDAQLQAVAVDADHLHRLREFGARSSIAAPLVARDRVIGTLTVIVSSSGRSYEPDHLALVEELAARAALALDNARLYESRNRVARSLQAALLPPALPRIDRLGLGARYRVAEGDIEIGGDFYDVVELGARTWGLVVGDVCGRGPDAAALTGLVRHSIRTALVREREPSRVLAQANAAVLDQIDDASFCTVAYLLVELPADPAGPVRVRASSAGHPRPAVVRADGHAELLDCAGLLLGVVPSLALVDVEVQLEAGDAVVLYTDGVSEARRGQDQFGDDRLVETLAGLAGADADGIAAGLEDAVSRFQDDASDDIAILVAQVLPPPGAPRVTS